MHRQKIFESDKKGRKNLFQKKKAGKLGSLLHAKAHRKYLLFFLSFPLHIRRFWLDFHVNNWTSLSVLPITVPAVKSAALLSKILSSKMHFLKVVYSQRIETLQIPCRQFSKNVAGCLLTVKPAYDDQAKSEESGW